ncbi:LOB domain-containing protein 25 [Nymphaea thermarum]|nr:LOB domain-containing protein 25 [Nymphaea thermarum]
MSQLPTPQPPSFACGACRFLRRKCTGQCNFAPYFPAQFIHRFYDVHRSFATNNVARLFSEISPSLRQQAVDSLVFEAESRVDDPVHACLPQMRQLLQDLGQLQTPSMSHRTLNMGYSNWMLL